MKNIIPFLLFIILTVSCGENNEFVKVEEINDVRVVNNLQEGLVEFKEAELRFVRTIGDDTVDNLDYFFHRPAEIVKDDDGSLYVLDAGNFRVLKLDKDLNLLNSIGKQGQGPGDFQRPAYLRVDNEENVYVADTGAGKIIVLNNEGKELRRIEFNDVPMDIPYTSYPRKVNYFFITNSGNFIKMLPEDTSNTGIYDNNGKLIRKIAKRREHDDAWLFTNGNYYEYAMDSQENLYLAIDNRNMIEKYSLDGRLLMQIIRNSGVEEIDSYEFQITESFYYIPSTEQFESQGLKERQYMNSFSSGIETDYKNRIWVLSNYKQAYIYKDNILSSRESNKDFWRFEIYNPDGVLIGRIPVPHDNFNKMRIFGSTMFLIDTNTDMVIYEYEIVDL